MQFIVQIFTENNYKLQNTVENLNAINQNISFLLIFMLMLYTIKKFHKPCGLSNRASNNLHTWSLLKSLTSGMRLLLAIQCESYLKRIIFKFKYIYNADETRLVQEMTDNDKIT